MVDDMWLWNKCSIKKEELAVCRCRLSYFNVVVAAVAAVVVVMCRIFI